MSILITVEGLDGTGKSTLVSALHERIQADQSFPKWVYQTKEPGLMAKSSGNLLFNRPGVDLRNIVLTNPSLTAFERELLFYVDASQHRRFINAQEDAMVLSDRGLWSHLAYAYATMKTRQMSYEQYLLAQALIAEVCPKPNVVVYLRGSLALMKARLADKTKDLIESNGDSFFENVLAEYEDLAVDPTSAKSLLILDAENSTSHNVELVLKYLKETFTDEELRAGNSEI